MRKLIVCAGLPGSGKSTWTRSQLEQHPDRYKRVNRDDLRSMIDNGKYSSEREKYIRRAEISLAEMFLSNGYTVIVDDCNLSESAKTMWQEFAQKMKATVEIKDFTDIPLEECIARDKKRPNYVGEQVIRRMHRDFLQKRPEPPAYDSVLPNALICDIDGTLALFDRKVVSAYDRDFTKDTLNTAVSTLLHRYHNDTTIFLFSGRQEKDREETMSWLSMHNVPYNYLYMRQTHDKRGDYIVKSELYNEHIKDQYNIIGVFDDRLQVCRLWYELGLPLFRVGDPDADF